MFTLPTADSWYGTGNLPQEYRGTSPLCRGEYPMLRLSDFVSNSKMFLYLELESISQLWNIVGK